MGHQIVEGTHLKLWIEGEEEGLSCAIKSIAHLKGLRCQSTKYLEKQEQLIIVDSEPHFSHCRLIRIFLC